MTRAPWLRASLLGFTLGPVALLASDVGNSIARIETRLKGRVGVYALRGSRVVSYRGEERFAYCSTFKWVLGAAILRRVDEGRLRLDQPVHYTEKDLLEPCTLTRAHLQEGQMSVGELCAATITTSDNAAANLLEPLVGGPSGLQSFVRGLGDPTMRFDRLEPELNSNHSGDPRDTTSPKAMTGLLRAALETDALSRRSRTRLLEWMKAVVTGSNRIPAALPRGWILGHKTGTGSLGAANDVAVIFPPAGPPIYLCIFTDGDRANLDRHEAAIAEIARLVLKVLG